MASVVMEQTQPFVASNHLLQDPQALRAQAQQDGYLFLPGLLAPAKVLALRHCVTTLLARHGFLVAGTSPADAVARPGVELADGSEEWRPFYQDVQRSRPFHALAHDPALIAVMEAIFARPVLVHPRHILRTVCPHRQAYTTPPHQDFWYIHGTQNTWTTWLPLGDCPEPLGGLAILPESHLGGVKPMRSAKGAGGQEVDGDVGRDPRWRRSPLSCGDVLVFHSLTIHQGLDNHTDRIRLSVDLRFQPIDEPVHASSFVPHMNVLTWEEIYADWPAGDPLQYYWKSTHP